MHIHFWMPHVFPVEEKPFLRNGTNVLFTSEEMPLILCMPKISIYLYTDCLLKRSLSPVPSIFFPMNSFKQAIVVMQSWEDSDISFLSYQRRSLHLIFCTPFAVTGMGHCWHGSVSITDRILLQEGFCNHRCFLKRLLRKFYFYWFHHGRHQQNGLLPRLPFFPCW